jgi:hypothetical protein
MQRQVRNIGRRRDAGNLVERRVHPNHDLTDADRLDDEIEGAVTDGIDRHRNDAVQVTKIGAGARS